MYVLSPSQKNAIKNARINYKTIGVELWTITKSSINTNDMYGRASTITSGSRIFSGALAWESTMMRLDSAGGYYKSSEVTIVCSLDEIEFLDARNNYLVCEGVKLRMKDFARATDTNELVVHCERLNE